MKLRAAVAGLFLFTFSVFAQSDRGTLTGTVSDPAGAVVPSAPIQAKNMATGEVYQGATSGTGNYTISQLPAGNYELSVNVQGFKKYTRQNLTIQVAQILRADVNLEVGSASESVTVTEAAALLATETGDLAHNVTTKFLDDVPLLTISGNIRNPSVFAQLIPGTYMTGQELRISGAPNNTQSLRVEGMEANNSGIPAIPGQSQQSVDSVQEVTIQTSNYAAEYGQAGGGVVNMTMKSGTNQFHGSVYDYFVNEIFNAGAPFTDSPAGNPRPRARRNDYGFTIGGPVWIPKIYNGHDKTFFFFNFEQYRETQHFDTLQETVPTPAYRTGDLSAALNVNTKPIGTDPLGRPIFLGEVYDPNTTRTDPASGKIVRDPFLGNKIDPARFDSLSAKILGMIPQPRGQFSNALVNNYIPSITGTQIESIPAVKIDQAMGSKGKLSFYWSRKWLSQPTSITFGGADGLGDPLTTAIASFIRSHTIRLNYDYTLTPTTLLHFGAGYFDTDFFVPSVTTAGAITNYNAAQQLGLQGAIINQFFPAISGLTGANSIGGMKNMGSGANTHQWTQKPTFNASLTLVRSSHTYKIGGEFRTEGYPVENLSNTTGSYAFAPDQTSLPYLNGTTLAGGQVPGFGYASFLLGAVQQVSIANPVFPRLGKKQLGLYAQDSWKITRTLTFDYGLRYDYSTYLQEQYGRAPYFSGVTPNPALGNILGAAIFDGHGPGHCNCYLASNYPYAFGPRLGLAYQINPKTVFRAGFGIVYNGTEANNGAATTLGASSNTVRAGTFGSSVTTLAAGIPRSFDPAPWPNLNPGLYNTVSPVPVPYGAAWLDPNAGRPARQYQWSIGFQREIMRDLVVEAEFVGNRGIWWNSLGQINLNAINFNALAAHGININNPSDVTLLTQSLNSPAVVQRGIGAPYAGFPVTQALAQALRPYPQFTNINTLFDPLGDTWYDSLQSKVTKRLSHGLTLNSTFTWSKTLTVGTERDPNPGSTGNAVFNDVFNRANNKYLSIYDQPFQFTLSASYLTPAWKKNRILAWITRDWSYGTFLAYRSGLPLQAPLANNNLNSAVFQTTFANRVPGQPLFTKDLNCHCFDPNTTFVLNPNAWTDPAPGQFGTSAAYYSDYRKQRRYAENMNLGRTWRIKERASFNLRIEFDNIFNRPVVNDPSNTNAKAPQLRLPNGNAASGFGYINTTTQIGGAGVPAVVGIPGNRTGLLVGRFTF